MARKRWSKALVVAALQEREATSKALNYQAVVVDDEPLAGAARRHFGSWDAALVAAGYDPDAIKRPRGDVAPQGTWTPEVIIEQIQADVTAGLEISAHAAQLRSSSLVARGQQLFGSWEAAVAAAGYDYEAVRKTRAWAPQEVIERIQELDCAGADLSDNTCATYDGSLYGAAATHFGGWPQALEAAGIDPDEARRTMRWSKPRILAAIARGHRGASLRAAACSEFGSWEAACEAAGLPSERASSEVVANRLRARREELGLSQRALAERAGTTHTAIRMIEIGRHGNPRIELVLQLARSLECCVEDVFYIRERGE